VKKKKKIRKIMVNRLALISVFNPIFLGATSFRAWHNKKKWAWLIPGRLALPRPLHHSYCFEAIQIVLSLLAYDGQTLEKMDCLRSVHLKKKSASLSQQHNIITEKNNMKPQCCHVTS
jgi:hypothetical protein